MVIEEILFLKKGWGKNRDGKWQLRNKSWQIEKEEERPLSNQSTSENEVQEKMQLMLASLSN